MHDIEGDIPIKGEMPWGTQWGKTSGSKDDLPLCVGLGDDPPLCGGLPSGGSDFSPPDHT